MRADRNGASTWGIIYVYMCVRVPLENVNCQLSKNHYVKHTAIRYARTFRINGTETPTPKNTIITFNCAGT